MRQPLSSSRNIRTTTFPTWLTIQTLLAYVIVVGALGLRLYRLGAQSLWLDEGGTWAIVTQSSWATLLRDLVSPTAAYPLYHLLLKAWLALAGDSEPALRLPSALAGVAMVATLMLAARRALPTQRNAALTVGLIAACSPYALWHAQDAKVYSVLMFVVALLLLVGVQFVDALTGEWPIASAHWQWPLGALVLLAVVSLFVHRLALLPVAGLLFGLTPTAWRTRRVLALALAMAAVCAAALGVFGLSQAVASNGWQESGHSAAGPIQSLWLNLQHFILDRNDIGGWLGLPVLVWALPGLVLTVWGLACAARDAWRGDAAATLVLAMFAVPMLLYALVLVFTPIYEARYAAVAFPAWLLVLVWPLHGRSRHPKSQPHATFRVQSASFALCVFLLVGSAGAVLLQPQHGLFSGAAVKEQWRESIAAIAAEAQPDDLIVLHPYYTLPLWQYYAPRVTPDRLQQPTVLNVFGQGLCVANNSGNPQAIRECYRRTYGKLFNMAAEGKKRALLLIAPDHAATIDPPKSLADLQREYAAGELRSQPTEADEYGWVGLRFLYPPRSWACGTDEWLGIKTMCLSFPELYRTAAGTPSAPPAPAIPLEATFGGEIKLLGYTVTPFGNIRHGGALPITLYWKSLVDPSKNYSVFLHLCQRCDLPPLAGVDGLPLRGYPPAGLTSLWRGYPVHDERSLALPATLAPGRYTLILGLRPADEDPADQSLRLPAVSTQTQIIGGNRIVLGEVEIAAAK